MFFVLGDDFGSVANCIGFVSYLIVPRIYVHLLFFKKRGDGNVVDVDGMGDVVDGMGVLDGMRDLDVGNGIGGMRDLDVGNGMGDLNVGDGMGEVDLVEDLDANKAKEINDVNHRKHSYFLNAFSLYCCFVCSYFIQKDPLVFSYFFCGRLF